MGDRAMEERTHAEQQNQPLPQTLQFEFRGDGFEYFKIWIVNVLLTIVTLGIYSAWAKVRNARYFYSNLYLDESNFRYLANPLTILKGRLIAVAVFIIYYFILQTMPVVGIGLSIALILAIPFFVNQSLAFNHRMSAYNNIQFRFKASYFEAFMVIYIWPLLGLLSLGILYPYALLQFSRYMVDNSSYGTTAFTFKATYKDYGIILLTLLGAGLVIGGMSWVIATFVPALAFVTPVILAVLYIGMFVYFTVSTANLYYRSTSIAEHRFDANISMGGYTTVMLINFALIVVTIGLYAPAAKVRMAKYIASCVTFNAAGPLDNFVAAEQQNISALGEEFGQVFDFGV